MVGRCPEIEVIVQGQRIPCILDTGSQVTLFSQTLFQRHFGDECIQDPSHISWLALKAANGLYIPYVGYAVLDFCIGGLEVKGKGVVIVRDDCINTEYGLLGMNVVADCWTGVFKGGHPGVAAFKSVFPPSAERIWNTAFAACRRAEASVTRVELQGVDRLQ